VVIPAVVDPVCIGELLPVSITRSLPGLARSISWLFPRPRHYGVATPVSSLDGGITQFLHLALLV
jgi:hypothetical protein